MLQHWKKMEKAGTEKEKNGKELEKRILTLIVFSSGLNIACMQYLPLLQYAASQPKGWTRNRLV